MEDNEFGSGSAEADNSTNESKRNVGGEGDNEEMMDA